MTEHDIRAPAFYYELEAQDDGPLGSEGPWRVSGVAVGEDSILQTPDGRPVLFDGDVLEAAADTQRGQPLSVDHPSDEDGQPTYPPPTDETAGKVVKAGYKPGKGLVYEAVVHDREIAKGIQAGSYEVSVHPVWEGFSERDELTGAYKPEGVKFLDLSVVSHGMDRANEARLGPSKELTAWARETDISAELTAADTARADVDDDPEGLVERLARKMGILPDRGDRRGHVRVRDQTSDGETIIIERASFDDASWMPCAHLEGDEYDIGPGLGPSIGDGMAMDAGETLHDGEIQFEEPLEEDVDVYVALHFASDGGEKLEHITSADGGYFYDRAFVGVAPDGTEVTAEADAPESTETTAAESAVETQDTDMGDETPDGTTDGQDNDPDGGDGGADTKTLGEMTPSEAVEALSDHGVVTEENADEIVAQAQDEITKTDQVDEIIAKSDDYDEDDRDELLASSPKVIDNVHERVREQNAVGLPGNAGAMGSLTASASGDTEDTGDYGTGVEGDGGD